MVGGDLVHLVPYAHLQNPHEDYDEFVVLVKVQWRPGSASKNGMEQATGNSILGSAISHFR